jgi:hypothetical protein
VGIASTDLTPHSGHWIVACVAPPLMPGKFASFYSGRHGQHSYIINPSVGRALLNGARCSSANSLMPVARVRIA